MYEVKNKMIEGFFVVIGAIIGGFSSIVATLIALKHERKLKIELEEKRTEKENQQWMKTEKKELYIEFSGLLNKVHSYISVVDEVVVADKDAFESVLKSLNNFFTDNSGRLALFLPSSIQKEVLFLRSVVYKLSSNEEARIIENLHKLKEHDVFKVAIKAQSIIKMLQEDIGIYPSQNLKT